MSETANTAPYKYNKHTGKHKEKPQCCGTLSTLPHTTNTLGNAVSTRVSRTMSEMANTAPYNTQGNTSISVTMSALRCHTPYLKQNTMRHPGKHPSRSCVMLSALMCHTPYLKQNTMQHPGLWCCVTLSAFMCHVMHHI